MATNINSLEYFMRELGEFRRLMGLKTFWEDDNKVDLAFKAITKLYFDLKGTPEEEKRGQFLYEVAVTEFTRRRSHVFMQLVKKLVE